MADAAVISVDSPMFAAADYDSGLSTSPFDTAFFPEGGNRNDAVIDDFDFDFDFAFHDLYHPSPDEIDDLLNPTEIQEFSSQPGEGATFFQFASNVDQFRAVSNSVSSELRHICGDADFSCDPSSNGFGLLNTASLGLESHSQQISGYVNVPSPESKGSNPETSENCGGDTKVLNMSSPEYPGSGNCGSNGSDDSNNCATRSVSSSSDLNNKSKRIRVVSQKVKLEDPSRRKVSSSLKRKNDSESLLNNDVESNQCKKSNFNSMNSNKNNNNSGLSEEVEKRKTRLMRNRDSAQLSRQRKKHYVEELEEKVKMMHSTIQDLNMKISYIVAENATLRQQVGSGGSVPPPPMAPPPPRIYPHPAMIYPWMPCAPPYMMKQGSQVPLVPIPRLKPQLPVQAPKANKKTENKKNEGPKTKKVAGVSFLGLLFFFMLFGCLVPMVNVRYGGVRETLTGGESYASDEFYDKHHGRVLMVNETVYGEKYGDGRDFSSENSVHGDQIGHDNVGKPMCNESEPLVVSLYVPRNDKLVKIDGNLIIYSVLASEKAISSHEKRGADTVLMVPGDFGPPVPVPGVRIDGVRHSYLKALGTGSADMVGKKPNTTDGGLQQWFQEGLAGPLLSSGMCTEVFQFDVSSASTSGAIVPATATKNISEGQNLNSSHLSTSRNRRILGGLPPIPLSVPSRNISGEHAGGMNSQKESSVTADSVSPMVVSVLVDPREVGGAGVDGVIGPKPLSRIFVVVLIDSVKYVTYSCMLPFKGTAII
ncbi:hypothetical protein OROGR_013822 [Orobanche gracilis]